MRSLKSILLFCALALPASPAWTVRQDSPENSLLNLKFIVIERAGLYPCAEDSPEDRARERAHVADRFDEIRRDSGNFAAVVSRLGLRSDARLSRDEQLLVGCYYSKLQKLRLEPEGDRFKVITDRGEELYIDANGRLTEMQTSVAVPSLSRPLREMTAASPTSGQPIVKSPLTAVAQRHSLIVRYGRLRFCSPMNQVSREYSYETMERADPRAFAEIRRLRGLTPSLSDQAKRDVLTEYEAMQSIRMERLIDGYYFELTADRAGNTGAETRIRGVASAHGRVRELRREGISVVCPK